MPISSIPSTPYGEIAPHWREWLDALDAWHAPVGMPRPRLYEPAGDRPALVRRIDEIPGFRPEMERSALAALDGELPDPATDPPARVLQTWLAKAVACADWWLVAGDERAAARAWQIAELAFVWRRWVADEHLPLTIDLIAASMIHSVAVLLDRLDGWLGPERRARLLAWIVERVRRFVEISDAHSEWWTYSLHNWRSDICGHFGIVALSSMEGLSRDLLTRALKHAVVGVLVVLDQGDEDGGWFEGVGYWRHGIGDAVEFADVLHRISAGAVDLFAHPYLRKTGDFGLHETWPDGRVFNWGDCSARVNATALLARLAKATRRADWQAYVRRFPARPSMETLFWEDPDLAAADLTSLPRVKHFRGTETAVLRAGWGDDDLVVGIKAGKTTANHSHLDVGSFVVTAGGSDLVADGGSWPYGHALGMFDLRGPRWDFPGLATECHSTILVDGQGQAYGREHDGVIVAAQDHDGWAFATVDATRAYPQLTHFVRYILLIRPDTVVVVDDLAAPERRRFGWRVVLPHPTQRTDWPTWVTRAPEGPSLAIRWLAPEKEAAGLMAEQTELEAVYPATSRLAEPVCSMLTISSLIRAREQHIAVAIRAGRGEPVEPRVSVTFPYRSVRIAAEMESGAQAWSIMWGEPGVQAVTA